MAVSASRVVSCFYMSTAFYIPLFMSVLLQWLRQKDSQTYPKKDTMSFLKMFSRVAYVLRNPRVIVMSTVCNFVKKKK